MVLPEREPAVAQLAAELGVAAALFDQFLNLAAFPVAIGPRQKLIGVGGVQSDEQSPAEQNLIEPGRARRRDVDEKQNEIDDRVNGQVVIEQPQCLDPAMGPLLGFRCTRGLAGGNPGRNRHRLAVLASHLPVFHDVFAVFSEMLPGTRGLFGPPTLSSLRGVQRH